MIQRRKHLQHRATEYQLKNRCFSLRHPGIHGSWNSVVNDGPGWWWNSGIDSAGWWYTMTIGPRDTTSENPIYNMEISIDGINWVVLDKSFDIPMLRRVYIRVRDGYEYNPNDPNNNWSGINFRIVNADDPFLASNHGYGTTPRGIELSGNILTLLYRNPNSTYTNEYGDIEEELPLPIDAFKGLFEPLDTSDDPMIDLIIRPRLEAEKLLLPSKTVSENAYQRMFHQSRLMTPPIIKAKTVNKNGMNYMFAESTLEFPPLLQARHCYESGMYGMFKDCTSLTIGFKDPYVLPLDLGKNACAYMFSGCNGVFQTPFMPATILKTGCYDGAFRDCKNLYCIFSSAYARELESGDLTDNLSSAMYGIFSGASEWIDSDDLNAYYTYGAGAGVIAHPVNGNWNQMRFKASGVNANNVWRNVYRATTILQHDFTDYTAFRYYADYSSDIINMAKLGGWIPRNPLACAKSLMRHVIFEGDINWPTWDGVPPKEDYPPETWPDYPIGPS